MRSQAVRIRAFLLSHIPKHPSDIVSLAVKRFGVTRTTIHRHMNTLLSQGKISKSGTTAQIQYQVLSKRNKIIHLSLIAEMDEFRLFQQYIKNEVNELNSGLVDILFYGFTEIVNNAKDHSGGAKLVFELRWEENKVILVVEDNGIGVFKKIYERFHLDDIRESILQLSIGKMTTDKNNHTGEGLFFTARVFDCLDIYANGWRYHKDNIEDDWFLQRCDYDAGSRLVMAVDQNSKRTLSEVFKQYQDPDTYAFDRTKIQVELAKFGEERFISRSQAKRILRNLDKFKHVTLDFKHVRVVGQGFVDEIFRVYQSQHPGMIFDYINANEDIDYMIRRGIATGRSV